MEQPKALQDMTDLELRAQRGDLYAELDNVNKRAQMVQNALREVVMEMGKRRKPAPPIPPAVEAPKPEETKPE